MLCCVNNVVVQLTISETIDKPGFELHVKCISILYLAEMNNNSINVSALFLIFVLFYVLFVLCCSVYCLCICVYCTTATGWLPNCS